MTSGDPIRVAAAPPLRTVGTSKRAAYRRQRPRSLTEAERDTLRVSATNGKSLRSLATGYGVSHETMRAILRG
jgi:hypothetical protein